MEIRRHIFRVAALVSLALALLSCGRKHKVVPRSEMAEIYADMFIADQWLMSFDSEFQRADTMLFYEPIFRKHGYTTEKFRESVNYYLYDARRFARILKKSAAIIEQDVKAMRKIGEHNDELADLEALYKGLESYSDTSILNIAGERAILMDWGPDYKWVPRSQIPKFEGMVPEPEVFDEPDPADSLALVQLDSLKLMNAADSLGVAVPADSLQKEEEVLIPPKFVRNPDFCVEPPRKIHNISKVKSYSL